MERVEALAVEYYPDFGGCCCMHTFSKASRVKGRVYLGGFDLIDFDGKRKNFGAQEGLPHLPAHLPAHVHVDLHLFVETR